MRRYNKSQPIPDSVSVEAYRLLEAIEDQAGTINKGTETLGDLHKSLQAIDQAMAQMRECREQFARIMVSAHNS